MTATIGIVTVLYNSDDVLPDFFASLAAQQHVHYRLYVIDNSKADTGTRLSNALAASYGIVCHAHFNNENTGVAKGNNKGIQMALEDECNTILLANNDTVFPDSHLLAKMLDVLISGTAELVTPKIKYFNSNRIWCAGGRMLEWRGTARHNGDMEEDCGQHDRSGFVTYAPTCFMMFPAHIVTSTSPMDEKYFVYYDDTDFIWRNNRLGNRLYYMAEGELFHKVSFSTGGDDSDFSVYYMSRNRTYFILKNLPTIKKLFALTFMLSTRPLRERKRLKMVLAAMRDGVRLRLSV